MLNIQYFKNVDAILAYIYIITFYCHIYTVVPMKFSPKAVPKTIASISSPQPSVSQGTITNISLAD